ncbi:MAG: hypothetical protein WC213_00010 [Arenimonas sp.]|jgi:hypothetical protein
MTLLTIITGACGEIGITQPTSVINSTDLQTLQLLFLAQKEGKELARRFDWQSLTKEGTFTTLAAETQVAAITTTFADFGRVVDNTMWNRTQIRPVRGPLNNQQWQRVKAAAAQVGVEYCFRVRGGAILFNPTPPAGDSVYFEYISNKWCKSEVGVARAAWAADSDTGIIDEEVMRQGIVWRFLKAKGLDYAEEFRTYEMTLADLFGPDAGNDIIDMEGLPDQWGVNIPDGSWTL